MPAVLPHNNGAEKLQSSTATLDYSLSLRERVRERERRDCGHLLLQNLWALREKDLAEDE